MVKTRVYSHTRSRVDDSLNILVRTKNSQAASVAKKVRDSSSMTHSPLYSSTQIHA